MTNRSNPEFVNISGLIQAGLAASGQDHAH